MACRVHNSLVASGLPSFNPVDNSAMPNPTLEEICHDWRALDRAEFESDGGIELIGHEAFTAVSDVQLREPGRGRKLLRQGLRRLLIVPEREGHRGAGLGEVLADKRLSYEPEE